MLNNLVIVDDTDDDFKYIDFLAHNSIASYNLGEKQLFLDQISASDLSNSTSLSQEADSHESSEIFSDLVLDYISQMLMEEDMDGKLDVLQSHPALEATERPFYEIIGEKYPPSPDRPPLHSSPSSESSDSHRSHYYNSNSITGVNHFADNDLAFAESIDLLHPHKYFPESSVNAIYGDADLLYLDDFSNPFFEDLAASQFEKGLKEAEKLIPSEDKLFVDVGAVGFDLPQEPKEDSVFTKVNAKDGRGRRHKSRHHNADDIEEQRRSKQSAVSFEEPPVSSEMLDMVLLCSGEKFPKVISTIREAIQNEAASKNSEITEHKKYGESQNSSKKKQPKKEVVDFQSLLMDCAQTVASGDHKRAYELLRQIRHHSSPHGDASQRVAYYFCNALEARLAGTGSEIYQSMVSKRRTLNDVLKAYQLYLSACPFKQVTYYFSNQTILDAIKNATRVHILDFGIFLGFQWPRFLQMLSTRTGGPPKLRITAIDKPMPGFRPTEMIEETGRRLADYAKRFGVPFEYQAVASKFDEVKAEDLRLNDEEILVVNCLFQINTLVDETMGVDCTRDKFLRNIRKLNPSLFVCATGNGSYGAPFFVTRFREALYHFSAIFDMMEMTAPRENEQRLLVERDLYAKFAINVISCEGADRVDWPETYKQSQVRFLRAGFHQLPVNNKYADKVKCAVRSYYHKDFSVDVDGRWLLQGWRGRILIAFSAWKPR
uniref:Scarecrow-like protein 9-like transcript variant X1 n=1 Tax=Cymbidium ensifolium TaxID=78740 RepID=A0A3G2CI19_CYMEN|nr:scarecrow-like protein 9-like transcript variant X1 [Cymbidium ensifolium]